MELTQTNLVSTDKDCQLEVIAGLTWLPWVGSNYYNAQYRVLIVGESHYCIGDNIEAEIEGAQNNKYFTRDIVIIDPIKREHNNAMFENLHRCLFQTIDINRENIWRHVAFYNFVQRPMKGPKDRPSKEDMLKGWPVFVNLIKTLKPTHCLFVGVKAADFFNISMINMGITHTPVKILNIENSRKRAKKYSLKLNDYALSCLAIQHTSHHFSWQKWHSFLQKDNEELLCYLNELNSSYLE